MTTPALPVAVGDIVRRGRGTTQWRITTIDEHLIALESCTASWTHASVTLADAHTLTRITPTTEGDHQTPTSQP